MVDLTKVVGKILYHEICGKADIFISQFGDSWIVGGEIEGQYRERMFNRSAYDNDEEFLPYGKAYSNALQCYDDTLNRASEIYKTPRSLPDKPDFTKVTKQNKISYKIYM